MRIAWLIVALVAVPGLAAQARKPNIVYILADDLGYGELGCYGQTKIRTPNLDRLAKQGVRFTRHYSGSTVCAPSRCSLLTGRHTGRTQIRGNFEMGGWERGNREGQRALAPNTTTLGTILQQRGYATAAIGKWGLGGPESTGIPNRQGFDFFYGYLCQRQAHNYYPEHLWRNEDCVALGNDYFAAHQRLEEAPKSAAEYAGYAGMDYAPDRMIGEALRWVRRQRERPFFLYFASPVPHVALQVPDDSLQSYANAFDETPYLGTKGYLPHPAPRAAYAAMITRFDADVGRLLALLDELGEAENTVVIFSSDNGPTYAGGVDHAFFASAGGLRGLKGSLFEGGIRVPMIVRWPGKVAAGRVTDHVSAFWDVLPTVCEIVGADSPDGIDGISFLPALTGSGVQREHRSLYWEIPIGGGRQAVRLGRFKAVRLRVRRDDDAPIALYDLDQDPNESTDIAGDHPEIVAEARRVIAARKPSPVKRWNYDREEPKPKPKPKKPAR